ncbi:unnamed protein product [Sphacelaria rigidula]
MPLPTERRRKWRRQRPGWWRRGNGERGAPASISEFFQPWGDDWRGGSWRSPTADDAPATPTCDASGKRGWATDGCFWTGGGAAAAAAEATGELEKEEEEAATAERMAIGKQATAKALVNCDTGWAGKHG